MGKAGGWGWLLLLETTSLLSKKRSVTESNWSFRIDDHGDTYLVGNIILTSFAGLLHHHIATTSTTLLSLKDVFFLIPFYPPRTTAFSLSLPLYLSRQLLAAAYDRCFVLDDAESFRQVSLLESSLSCALRVCSCVCS